MALLALGATGSATAAPGPDPGAIRPAGYDSALRTTKLLPDDLLPIAPPKTPVDLPPKGPNEPPAQDGPPDPGLRGGGLDPPERVEARSGNAGPPRSGPSQAPPSRSTQAGGAGPAAGTPAGRRAAEPRRHGDSGSAAASGGANDEGLSIEPVTVSAPQESTSAAPAAAAISALFEFVPTSVKALIAALAGLAGVLGLTTLRNRRKLALAESRAATDALTGLPNRSSIQRTLKEMLARAGRANASLAVVVFDLDNFKRINDRYGHLQGDRVLVAVGDVASRELRAGDFVGRYGGEEFVLLLPDTDGSGAAVAAEKLRELIAATAVPAVGERITASFGVAALPEGGASEDELLQAADRALYVAKALGRNRVERAVPAASVPQPVAS